jgi:hypothetical protein
MMDPVTNHTTACRASANALATIYVPTTRGNPTNVKIAARGGRRGVSEFRERGRSEVIYLRTRATYASVRRAAI